MAEVSKSRLSLDLDDIERQLRQSSPQPTSGKSDPLAELARIVGQDDPFRALLAPDPRPARGGYDAFATRNPAVEAPSYGQPGVEFDLNGLRGSVSDDGFSAHQGQDIALTAEEDAILHGQGSAQHYAGHDAGSLYDHDGHGYESAFAPVVAPRRRKGAVMAGVVLGAAVLGIGGVFAYRGTESINVAGGEPPVVKAETGPSKIAPQNPGGVDIPNQNKQIYERTAQDGQMRIVNREEQPVDVRQATRSPAFSSDGSPVRVSPSAPSITTAAGGASPAMQGLSGSAAGVLGEPRRVRTVSIRPDGTMVTSDQSGAARPVPPVGSPTMVLPQAGAASGPATSAAASTPVSPGSMNVLPPQRPRDVTSTPAPAKPVAMASIADQQAGSPLQITSDGTRTKTAAAPLPFREPTETSAAPATGAGGFAVQLGVRGTEREARSVFDQLQQRYASDLGGFSPSIRQAEINGKTAYRLRVGPLSRDEATSLCSRLKASGGQCFVANN
jgi:hypothetical protein